MPKPVLEVRHLYKRFGDRLILKDINLTVYEGEIFVIIGGSGSGKSTLLRIIAGLETPDRGQVIFDGQVVTQDKKVLLPAHQRKVGFIFQDLGMWEHMSVEEHLTFVLSARGKKDQKLVEELLIFFGLQELRKKRPATLSGGERQRLALARALAQEPHFLLLDEPFSNLDLPRKKKLHREFLKIREERGLGMIYVTHDPLDVRLLSDQVLVLHEGRVVQQGTYEDLLSRPAHPVVRELLVYD